MAERILSEETINTFREYLVLEEKSTATVEKYLRDVRAFHLFAGQQAVETCKHGVDRVDGVTSFQQRFLVGHHLLFCYRLPI